MNEAPAINAIQDSHPIAIPYQWPDCRHSSANHRRYVSRFGCGDGYMSQRLRFVLGIAYLLHRIQRSLYVADLGFRASNVKAYLVG